VAAGYEELVGKDDSSLYLGRRTTKQPKYREGERGWDLSKK